MTEEERTTIFMNQTDDIYRSIGKFAVNFEHIVFYMRTAIVMLMSSNGLKNQQLTNILVADQTAYPMWQIFRSIIKEVLKPQDTDAKIVNAIMKQINEMIENRNNIIHSTWCRMGKNRCYKF